MEIFSRNIDNQEVKSVDTWDFDDENLEQQIAEIQKDKEEDRKQRESKIADLVSELNDDSDKKEKVEEFIWKNCVEPMDNVDRIVPFGELVEILKKSAKDEWLDDVYDSIIKGNAKDKRIYELPAYKDLIEEWFILPSDVRTYYDSANREPVYHLWVDYNVKAWKGVKSIYDGKVVASGLDWWLWYKVIIEHSMSDWTKFYSLYGHMGSKNLPKVWDNVKKWDIVGEVWQPFTPDNWDWEEHLHFQIMESVDSPKWYSKIEWELNYDVLKAFGKKNG